MTQRVLIVDDERLIRELLAKSLEQRGHAVSFAVDGRDALEKIGESLPDLVLLDLMMPKMDGFDVLEVLRADPRTEGLQVIVLTARASQEVLQEALESGADDYISKPFHLGEVVSRVEAHLRIARYAKQLDRQRRDGHTLLDISHRLTSRLDIQSILHDVAGTVAEVLDTDRCSVVLVDEEARVGRVVAASDDAGVTDREISIDAYPEIRRVLDTGEPVIVSDITADPLFDPVKDQLAGLGVRSAALFPLREGPRCIGVLFLRSLRPWQSFGEREKQYGQIVANAAAVAVTNARLFSEIKEESDRISHARAVVEQRLRIVQRYEDFFENAADGTFIVDPDGQVLFVNRQAEAITGTRREEACGQTLHALCHPADRAALDELLERARGGDFSQRVDLRVGEEPRVVSVSAARIPGDPAFSLTVRDVTEERRLERELARTRDFLEALIDASPDAVVAADLSGAIKVFNKAAEKLFGYRAEDVVGHVHVRQLYPEGGAAELLEALRAEAHGGVGRIVPAIDRQVRDAHGDLIPVLLSGSVVQVHGRESAAVMILQDQRPLIEMETQLVQTRERLAESEKTAVLAELAGTTAHELNQPLTSVMGYAELLERRLPEDDPNYKAAITIQREAQRMADIVKKIGRITRYETKPYVGGTRIIDLAAAADSVESPD